jgi:hypothetical protein
MQFNPTSRKAIALILVVFLLGIAIGAVGNMLVDRRVFGARVRGGQPRQVPPLARELDLSSDQQKKLTSILMDMQDHFDAVRRQMDPQFEQIRNQGHDEIRQILTPEQRPKFEDFLQRLSEERRKRANAPR